MVQPEPGRAATAMDQLSEASRRSLEVHPADAKADEIGRQRRTYAALTDQLKQTVDHLTYHGRVERCDPFAQTLNRNGPNL